MHYLSDSTRSLIKCCRPKVFVLCFLGLFALSAFLLITPSITGGAASLRGPLEPVQACTLTCPANVTQANDPGQCGAIVNYPPPVSTCTGVTCAPPSGSFFPVGPTTVTCTVSTRTTTTTCTFEVTVNDTQNPTITCPANLVVPADDIGPPPNFLLGEDVTFAATATDNCPGVTVVCTPPSGSFFPVGTTTVTCKATDASGNMATCSFTVTVNLPHSVIAAATFLIVAGSGEPTPVEQQQPRQKGLLVADFHNGLVRVFISNGDGTLRLGQAILVGNGPDAIVVGDFNHDGKTDAAIANDLSNDVSILMGNGDGTFTRLRNIQVGRQPSALGVGDFTGDGVLDLVVANFSDDNLQLLEGRGDGTFNSARLIPVGISPSGMAVGDFDRDGKLDLAVSNFGSNSVTILLGNGDGSFTRVGNVPVGQGPIAITSGDFNGDGRLDLATANFFTDDLTILMNEPGGPELQSPTGESISESDAPAEVEAGVRFRVARTLSAGHGPVAILAAPLLTRQVGLAVADILSGDILIRLGDKNGSLTDVQRHPGTPTPASVTADDLNNDGRLDLAILDLDGMTIRVLLDNGDGTFRVARGTGGTE